MKENIVIHHKFTKLFTEACLLGPHGNYIALIAIEGLCPGVGRVYRLDDDEERSRLCLLSPLHQPNAGTLSTLLRICINLFRYADFLGEGSIIYFLCNFVSHNHATNRKGTNWRLLKTRCGYPSLN